MSLDALQFFKNQYSTHQNAPGADTEKKLFAAAAALYSELPTELHQNIFYRFANEVLEGESRILTPEQCSTLRASAENYRTCAPRVFQAISLASTLESVQEEMSRLRAAHENFSQAYTQQYLTKDPVEEAYASKRDSCDFLFKVFSKDYEKNQQALLHEDYSFYDRLVALAVEELLAKRAQEVPEIFSTARERIYKMSFTHRDLPQNQQKLLHQKLLGDNVNLSPVTQELFLSIYQVAFTFPKKDLLGPLQFVSKKAQESISHIMY